MSINLDVFAVDGPRFTEFLKEPLIELFRRYIRDGTDPRVPLYFSTGDSFDNLFADPQGAIGACAAPNGKLKDLLPDGAGPQSSPLSESELGALPFLQRPACDHLSAERGCELSRFILAFDNCAGIDFIQSLIWYHRRWWIGSVLQTAFTVLNQQEFGELEFLFRRLLRGWNCGFPLPEGDVGIISAAIPFKSGHDPDMQLGFWSEREVSNAVTHLSKIVASSPTFSCPPDVKPDGTDWQKYTPGNVESLLKSRDLGYAECNVLSFIG